MDDGWDVVGFGCEVGVYEGLECGEGCGGDEGVGRGEGCVDCLEGGLEWGGCAGEGG